MAEIRAIVLAFTALLPLYSQTSTWKIEAIDTTAAGRFSSLKFDKDGNGHVAYVTDDDQHSLRYAFWDRALRRWFPMTVARQASFSSLALDSKQRPHISYADFGTAKGAKLRHAYWNGTTWTVTSIPLTSDVIAYYTSIVLDTQDNPVISFYEYEGPGGVGFVLRLRVVCWNGQYWEVRTVDQAGGSGKFNSILMDSGSRPGVAYANVKAENAGLRYGHWNGKTWETEILEGLGSPVYVYSVAAVFDAAYNPHLVYTDLTNHVVKYATRQNGSWQLQVVDAIVKEAYPDRNGITVDAHDNPYVTFYDAGASVLKFAYRKGNGWSSEIVDRNLVGFTSSVQIHDGEIWITYADEGSGTLRCARRRLQDFSARESELSQAVHGSQIPTKPTLSEKE